MDEDKNVNDGYAGQKYSFAAKTYYFLTVLALGAMCRLF